MFSHGERMHFSEAELIALQLARYFEGTARKAAFEELEDDGCAVFLRNLPVRCREEEIACTLAGLGWGGDIAFVSLPLRPAKPGRAFHNRGYGFVYFNSPFAARAFLDAMVDGFRISTRLSSKVVLVEHTRGFRSQEGPVIDAKGVGTSASSSSSSSIAPTQILSMADWTGQLRLPNPATVQWLRL
eukprot:TRINITY_DN74087_c0_g1_i1.p1 TRINITY_DN74087_c0_g1~~TRINITY_DN74087_c0_g1_i1.p1  ORF type:complete len:186 (-),score=22.24 TRINITY_DN74087_c0_g1_i1:174-731(-)